MNVFAAAQLAGGTLVTAAVLAAAVDPWLNNWRSAVRHLPSVMVTSVALVAIAVFVWLRPGVKPSGAPGLLYVIAMTALVAGIVAIARVADVRQRMSAVLVRADRTSAPRIIALSIVLAIPVIALPIALHWDVSGWMDSQSYDTFAINIVTGKAPQGSSGYMPVYQYGMAFLYYVFGHFFFVQQIVNALLAVAGLASLGLAAWLLFDGSGAATVIAGILYVYSRQLFYAIHFTQIETWYVPIVCMVLLAWAVYWRRPSLRSAAVFALAIGLGLNTRNQGALFFAFMCAAPLLVAGLPWSARLRHAAMVGLLVALTLVPWTIRNYVVEGRLSAFADRSAMYIGILTDPRIGLYGVRYWEGWDEVAVDYQARYPDPSERERAYLQGAWRNVMRDPAWLARAVAWRTAAFYGVLPDGLFNLDGIVATNWREEWPRYLFARTTPLLLLPLSIAGLIMRPGRTSLFLAGAIAASLAITVVSASPEDRISYPVLPLHILLAAGVFAGKARGVGNEAPVIGASIRWRTIAAAAVVSLIVFGAGRTLVGSRFEYRPLMARSTTINPALTIDPSLPRINDFYREQEQGRGAATRAQFANGRRARVRVMLSNYMYPPKFVGPVPFVPGLATDAASSQYFYAYLLTDDAAPLLGPAIGLTFDGAALSEGIREGDAVEIEGTIEHGAPESVTGFWLRVLKVKKLPIPANVLPVFP